MELFGTASSLNSYVRQAYNTRMVERIIDNVDLGAEFDIHTCPEIQEVIKWGILDDVATHYVEILSRVLTIWIFQFYNILPVLIL